MTHTPGPWKVKEKDSIVGPRGNTIAECFGYSDKATDTWQKVQGGRESNAAFIVHACNSHEAMLEACRAALANVAPMYSTQHHVVKLLTEAIRLAEGRG